MAFEGLICPACSNLLEDSKLKEKLLCPHCKINLKQKTTKAPLEPSHFPEIRNSVRRPTLNIRLELAQRSG